MQIACLETYVDVILAEVNVFLCTLKYSEQWKRRWISAEDKYEQCILSFSRRYFWSQPNRQLSLGGCCIALASVE